MQFVETPFRETVVIGLQGDGGDATLDRSVNVNTSSTVLPTIHAQAVPEGTLMRHAMLMALAARDQQAAASARGSRYATAITTVDELLDLPATRAVLDAVAPSVVGHPRIEEARPYTHADLVQYLPQLTLGLLGRIDAEPAGNAPASAPPEELCPSTSPDRTATRSRSGPMTSTSWVTLTTPVISAGRRRR